MDTNSPAEKTAVSPPQKCRRGWRRCLSFSILATFVLGIVFVIVFNMTMDWTNQESFCLSCHEMKDNVYREYQATIHYSNRSGMRAVCADCHVPKEFFPKVIRKIEASKELWHKALGSIDTREKFLEKRAQLAQNEWRRMQANDSQECRNCHDQDSFDLSLQGYRSVNQHEDGLVKGQTCIDCHKGIAHQLPRIDQGLNLADPPGISLEIFRPPAQVPTAAIADVADTGNTEGFEEEAEGETLSVEEPEE